MAQQRPSCSAESDKSELWVSEFTTKRNWSGPGLVFTIELPVNDEASLVSRCLQREPDAMRKLVERFQDDVFAVAFRTLGHREDAEDVCQDVFLRVFRSLRRWDPKRPLKPWILRITVNCCRSSFRKRSRRPAAHESLDHFAIAPPSDDSKELALEIGRAVNRLRFDHRLVFNLYHFEGIPYDSIAEIVGRPIGTVKTWLHRARLEVLRQLQERGMLEDATLLTRAPHGNSDVSTTE